MGIFVTCGFPSPDDSVDILTCVVDGGADFIEIGMPFSDPLAEGPPIQHSSSTALRFGVNLETVFETAESFRRCRSTPTVLMGYYNPILAYGVSNFCRRARSSGVDALIVPDLPPEEAGDLSKSAREYGLDTVFLVAPNTPDDRMQAIDQWSSGFVYAVSVTGVTGSPLVDAEALDKYLLRARTNVTRNPILVGFGIRSAHDAARLSRNTDGFIVGSALVPVIDGLWSDATIDPSERLDRLRACVASLRPRE